MEKIIKTVFGILGVIFAITAIAQESFIKAQEHTDGVSSVIVKDSEKIKEITLTDKSQDSVQETFTETGIIKVKETDESDAKNNNILFEQKLKIDNELKVDNLSIINSKNPLKLNYYDESGINSAAIDFFAKKLISIDILNTTNTTADGIIRIAGTNCNIKFKKLVKNIAKQYCTDCNATQEGQWIVKGFSCPKDPGFVN